MVIWVVSYSRSGNTFFRVILRQLYGVNTYAAFHAGETLLRAGAGDLVGHRDLPKPLREALDSADHSKIRQRLDELDAQEELFFFKTHAAAYQLFDTKYKAVLVVRDGRDALVSFANYFVDIPFDIHAWRWKTRRFRARTLLDIRAWIHPFVMISVGVAKQTALRRRLVSRQLDRLLRNDDSPYLNWSLMNRSWLDHNPTPEIVYYDDLTADPVGTVRAAVDRLGLGLVPKIGVSVPTFGELKERYPSFFREGRSGDWKDYFTPRQEQLFLEKHREMMGRLGFTQDLATSPTPLGQCRE